MRRLFLHRSLLLVFPSPGTYSQRNESPRARERYRGAGGNAGRKMSSSNFVEFPLCMTVYDRKEIVTVTVVKIGHRKDVYR
ncbi:MAG TPA: hypothetical protein VI873_01795 [Candidatus Peribacteraceae bacterium]|nr:hypothetical protein [Candidatus Peribacteraceae bacterium]